MNQIFRQMQYDLHEWCKAQQQDIVIPDVNLFGWPSDIITVGRAGLIREYEIVTNQKDFDFEIGRATNWMRERRDQKRLKHKMMRARDRPIPSRFYYVVPASLQVDATRLPEYAGLIYNFSSDRGVRTFEKIKNAPYLHQRVKVSESQLMHLTARLCDQLWARMSGAADSLPPLA
jgi:hypothetical protein